MRVMRSRGFTLGLMFATALSCSLLPTAGRAYTPEQQQACQPDAFRLCGPEIPDVDRVTACMIAKKSQLSPQCRAFFRSGPEREEVSEGPGRQADEHQADSRAQAEGEEGDKSVKSESDLNARSL